MPEVPLDQTEVTKTVMWFRTAPGEGAGGISA